MVTQNAINSFYTVGSNQELTKTLQPAFLAQVIPAELNATGDSTVVEPVVVDSERYDQNADYDGAGTYTAPVGSKALVTVNFNIEGLAAAHDILCSIKNVGIKEYYVMWGTQIGDVADNGGHAAFSPTYVLAFDAADTSDMYINVRGGAKSVDFSVDFSFAITQMQ